MLRKDMDHHHRNAASDSDAMSHKARRPTSLRLREFDYRRSGPYHVILGTHRKQALLGCTELAERLIALLQDEAAATDATVHAYCFMPDHVHILISLGGGDSLNRFVQRFKSRAARIHRQLGKNGKLWQRGFYDHILRSEETVEVVARYVLGNAVRKGLAQSTIEYPFSGSFVFDKAEL